MAAHKAPPSLGFSWQEHWSGLPFPSPMRESEKWKWSRSVVSDPQRPHGLQPSRLLHPWDFPGKSTGVGCHCLLRIPSLKRAISKNVFIPSLKKGNFKKCSDYRTITFVYMLVRLCSKSFKLGFNNMWTKNFQLYKLGFKEAEEPEIELPALTESWRKEGGSRKTPTSTSLATIKPLSVWMTTNCGKFFEMGIPDHLWKILWNGNTRPPDLPPEKSVCRSRSNSYNWTWNNRLVPNWERNMSRLYVVTLLI